MSDKRFSWKTEKLQHLNDEVLVVVDNKNEDWKGHILNIVDLLNSLAEENDRLRKYNKQLKERLEKINDGYGHLTYRNGLTANEWLIESQEKELKKKNEQISDLEEENEQLRKELDCFHPVMFQDMRKGTVVLYLKELK